MSPTTIIAIAVPVLVVLAGVLLFAAARRRDTGSAEGVLSSETARRDRGPVELSEEGRPVHGREVERAAVLARRESAAPVKVAEPPVAWVPPDDETLGVTRRQFFNRSIVVAFILGLSGFGASMLAFLWPSGAGGFGSKITVGSIDDINTAIDEGGGFAYYPEGRMWVTKYPSEALTKAKAVYSPPELTGMEAGLIALYQKCPHLGCRRAIVRHLGVVRVWLPRLAVQPGRREEGRPGPPGHGPVRHEGGRQPVHRRHRHASSRVRRSAPTPPAKRPRAPTASEAAATDERPVHVPDRAGCQHGHHHRRHHRS